MAFQIEKQVEGSVSSPKGFQATGLSCGIKKSGRADLALLVSEERFAVAGVFTQNQLKGASLQVTIEHIGDGYAQAVLVNSGNSNSCTGERGIQDAIALSHYVAEKLSIDPRDVLPSSTGVIGEFLPVDQMKAGIDQAVLQLSPEHGIQMAEAIMTTDNIAKYSARKVTVGDQTFTLGGITKGSGMIHPNMATMLAYITTDADIAPDLLKALLKGAVQKSFNRLSIDGDMSCCDTVLLMANGLSQVTVTQPGECYDAFQLALEDLCLEFTYLLAQDGEGVNHVVTVHVEGAPNQNTATQIAQSIAKSPLVKTAFNGQDPNWGRIINAAGYSGAHFDPSKADLWIEHIQVMQNGMRANYVEDEAHQIMKQPRYQITLNLNQGDSSDFYITTDFSNAYVDINADYRNRT